MKERRTASVTDSTRVALGALLSSTALAHVADDVLGAGELGRLALVQLLQADLVLLLYRSSFPWHVSSTGHASHAAHSRHSAKSAHSAEHLRKDVVDVRAFAAHTASGRVEGSHAVGVVHVSLVIVGEDLVGLFRGLEASLGLCAVIFCDLVGMVC